MSWVQVLTSKVPCYGNGEVVLPFADKHYLGLGLVVFFGIIAAELFGSPFIRNIEVSHSPSNHALSLKIYRGVYVFISNVCSFIFELIVGGCGCCHQIVIGLVIGMIVAASAHYTDCSSGTCVKQR